MDFTVTVEKLHSNNSDDMLEKDPVKALDTLEELRLQAGKFLYEYPARLRRVVEVIRKK